MKKFSKLMVLFLFLTLPIQSYASCDFAKDIKSNSDGTYTYTRDCHVEVGKAVKKVPLLEGQVEELNKTIELKDLALVKQKERADLWMNTSLQMNDKLQSYESTQSLNNWVHFGIGVGVTVLSVWAAGQLAHH